ncbi:hypothetical protein M885DRAFT_589383 [Pelagophyceae sp. CCMP2097]|nr:hypothetical protein M885DRAFT_589383 [Pelagophyceae sp. CCMP2097]
MAPSAKHPTALPPLPEAAALRAKSAEAQFRSFREQSSDRHRVRRAVHAEAEFAAAVDSAAFLDARIAVVGRAQNVAVKLDGRSEHRVSLIDADRAQSVTKDFEAGRRIRDAAQLEVERYTRGEYLLADPAAAALADLDCERRLFAGAAAVLRDAPGMAELGASGRAEALRQRPPADDARAATAAASETFVRLGEAAAAARAEASRLRQAQQIAKEALEQTSDRMRNLLEGLNVAEDKGGLALAERPKARVDLETLRAAEVEQRALMDAAIANYVAGAPEDSRDMVREGYDADGSVTVWVVGVPVVATSNRAAAGAVYYAAFSTGGPLHNLIWSRVQQPGGGPDATDGFAISALGTALSSKARLTGATHDSYSVSGSAMRAANGTYSKTGERAAAPCFGNDGGVYLFRATLHESPELFVTVRSIGTTTLLNERVTAVADELDISTLAVVQGDALGTDFEPLAKFGRRLSMLALHDEKARRSVLAQAREEVAATKFAAKRKRAADRLKAVEEGTLKDDAEASSSDGEAASPSRKIPNMTFQSTAADVRALGPGVDRVIHASVDARGVPPLCKAWVEAACVKNVGACRGRHYYISDVERNKWVRWREARARDLDKRALGAIVLREALLEELRTAAAVAKSEYLGTESEEDEAYDEEPDEAEEQAVLEAFMTGGAAAASRAPTKASERTRLRAGRAADRAAQLSGPVVELMDRVRAATVDCVETICDWRLYYARQRRMAAHTSADKRGPGELKWLSTIETEGHRLWEGFPAVFSKYKKYARAAIPAKRATVVKFLGLFPDRPSAEAAHDAARPLVALEKRMLETKLPPRVEREIWGGIHVVESRGSRPLLQLEAQVRARAAADEPPMPSYFWDGANYLGKMGRDLDWLDDLPPLKIFVGDFELKGNPLLLSRHLRVADARGPDGRAATGASTVGRSVSFADEDDNSTIGSGSLFAPARLGGATGASSRALAALSPGRGKVLASSQSAPVLRIAPGSPGGGSQLASPVSPLGSVFSNFDDAPQSRALASFGGPTEVVQRHRQGALLSWGGAVRAGTRFELVGERTVELLDMVRVRAALRVLDEEAADSGGALVPAESAAPAAGAPRADAADAARADRPRRAWAVYEELGATLLVEQPRAPLQGLVESVFCRAESGKWQGVGLPGPATKAYWFRRRMGEDSDRRKDLREHLAAQLRAEADRGVVEARSARIRELLGRAEELRGAGRLKTDAARAARALKRREATDVFSAKLCTAARRRRQHAAARERRGLLERLWEAKLARRRACLATAATTVAFCVSAAVKRAAHTLTRPVHVSTQILDGEQNYMMVYSREHEAKVSVAAKRKWVYGTDGTPFDADQPPAPGRAVQPCLARDAGTLALWRDWAPLVDGEGGGYAKWAPPPEALLVSAYDPATQRSKGMRVENARFCAALRKAETAVGLVELYPDPEVRFEVQRLSRWLPVAQCDVLLGYSSGAGRRDRWDPMREERLLIVQADDANRFEAACWVARLRCVVSAAAAGDGAAETRERHETAGMRLSDCEAYYDAFSRAYLHAVREALAVQAMSRAEVERFDAVPDPDLIDEDWRQSSDAFENGNDWRVFRLKRKLEVERAAALKRLSAAKLDVETAKSERRTAHHQWQARLLQLERAREASERSAMGGEAARDAAARATARRSAALNVALSCLTLRRLAAFGPRNGARALLWKKAHWGEAETLQERAQRPIWRAWNCAVRRAMVVTVPAFQLAMAKDVARLHTSTDAAFRNWLRRRFVVTLRQDSVLGDVLFVAEDGPGICVELSVSIAEVAAIVAAAGRPELGKPFICAGPAFRAIDAQEAQGPLRSLALAARLRRERADAVADVLCAKLHLDAFTGELRVGALRSRRRVDALKRRLLHGDGDAAAGAIAAGAAPKDAAVGGAGNAVAASNSAVGLARPSGRWLLDSIFARRTALRGMLVFREVRQVVGSPCLVQVYETWGDLRFECYEPISGASHCVCAEVAQVVESLLHDFQHVVLAQYLRAVAVNSYPPNVMRELADRLDFVLPGEESPLYSTRAEKAKFDLGGQKGSYTGDWASADGSHLLRPQLRWRRRPLEHERPRLVFQETRDALFRGPVWSSEKARVSGRVARLAVLEDQAGGLRVVVAAALPAEDGSKDPRYTGETLVLDVPGHTLPHILQGCSRVAAALGNEQALRRKARVLRRAAVDDDRRAARKRPRRRRFKARSSAALLVLGTDDSVDSSSGDSVSDDTDDSDAGEAADAGLLSAARKFELVQFLVRRIAFAAEDDAFGTPAGARSKRREAHRGRLGEALLDFERWTRAAAPPLAGPGADAVCARVRKSLALTAARSGGGARPALTLVAFAEDDAAQEGVIYVAPWAPATVGPLEIEAFTAHVSLDSRNDFVVSVARVSEQDLAARRTRVEGAQMAAEDDWAKRASAFRANAEAESRTALRAFVSRQAAELVAQDHARLARRTAAAAAAERAEREAERLDGALYFQKALLEAARRAIQTVLTICVDADGAHLRLNDSGDGGDFSSFWETAVAAEAGKPTTSPAGEAAAPVVDFPTIWRPSNFGVDCRRWPLWGGGRTVVCQHATTLKVRRLGRRRIVLEEAAPETPGGRAAERYGSPDWYGSAPSRPPTPHAFDEYTAAQGPVPAPAAVDGGAFETFEMDDDDDGGGDVHRGVRAVSRGPWVVRCELLCGTLRFEAYDPATGARLAVSTPALDAATVRASLLAATGAVATSADAALLWEPRRKRHSLRLIEAPCLTSVEALCAVAAAAAAAAMGDAQIRCAEAVAAQRVATSERLRRGGIAGMEHKAHRVDAPPLIERGPGVALSIQDGTVCMRFAADADVEARLKTLPNAGILVEVARLLKALESDVGVRYVALIGTLDGRTFFPEGTRLACLAWDASTLAGLAAEAIPKPNDRATALVARFARNEADVDDSAVFGPAVWLSPAADKRAATLTAALLANDADLRRARNAIRAAVRALCQRRVESVDEARARWLKRAEKRARPLVPWLERAFRAARGSGRCCRGEEAATAAIFALQKIAHAAGASAREDPFRAAQLRIHSASVDAAADSVSADLEGLGDGSLHAWLVWRGVVVAHACRCKIAAAACAAPCCALAHRRAASRVDGDGKPLARFQPAAPPAGEVLGDAEATSLWATEVASCVDEILCDEAALRDAARDAASALVEAHGAPVQGKQAPAVPSAAPRSDGVKGRAPAASFRRARRRFYDVALRLEALQLDVCVEPEARTQMHNCFVTASSAAVLARGAALRRRAAAPVTATVPRALLALLVADDASCDARGADAGATSREIASPNFVGNTAFFAWLLSRVRLEAPRKRAAIADGADANAGDAARLTAAAASSIGRLRFDADHVSRAVRLGDRSLHFRVSQPVPARPVEAAVAATRGSTAKREADVAVGRRVTTLDAAALGPSALSADGADPGVCVEVRELSTCCGARLVLPLAALVDAMPLTGARGLALRNRMLDASKRPEFANWLAMRAQALFSVDGNGALSLRLRSRRAFVATALACPPDAVAPAAQQRDAKRRGRRRETARRRHLDRTLAAQGDLSNDSDSDSDSGAAAGARRTSAAREFSRRSVAASRALVQATVDSSSAARTLARLGRLAEARAELTRRRRFAAPSTVLTAVCEWPSMAAEDACSRAARPFLAAEWATISHIPPAFQRACVEAPKTEPGAPKALKLQRVGDVREALRPLVAAEDAADAAADGGAIDEEAAAAEDHLEAPVSLEAFVCWWQTQAPFRGLRRVARKDARRLALEREEAAAAAAAAWQAELERLAQLETARRIAKRKRTLLGRIFG